MNKQLDLIVIDEGWFFHIWIGLKQGGVSEFASVHTSITNVSPMPLSRLSPSRPDSDYDYGTSDQAFAIFRVGSG